MTDFTCHRGMDSTDSILVGPKAANADQYSAEVLSASWAPAFSAVAGTIEAPQALATEHAVADADAFLPRFYRSQGA